MAEPVTQQSIKLVLSSLQHVTSYRSSEILSPQVYQRARLDQNADNSLFLLF